MACSDIRPLVTAREMAFDWSVWPGNRLESSSFAINLRMVGRIGLRENTRIIQRGLNFPNRVPGGSKFPCHLKREQDDGQTEFRKTRQVVKRTASPPTPLHTFFRDKSFQTTVTRTDGKELSADLYK